MNWTSPHCAQTEKWMIGTWTNSWEIKKWGCFGNPSILRANIVLWTKTSIFSEYYIVCSRLRNLQSSVRWPVKKWHEFKASLLFFEIINSSNMRKFLKGHQNIGYNHEIESYNFGYQKYTFWAFIFFFAQRCSLFGLEDIGKTSKLLYPD